MNIPKTSYQTNSHTLPSIYLLLYIAFSAGMAGMFLTIYAGMPVLVSMAGLLIPMLLVFGLFSGSAVYTIDEQGLHKQVSPWLLKGKPRSRSFLWSDVRSYKNGTDMSRGLQQYEYLQIYFKGTTWQLTDQKNKAGFLQFKAVFMNAVNTINLQTPATTTAPALMGTPFAEAGKQTQPTMHKSVAQNHPLIIQRNKTFYETVWAKLFFWVIVIFTIYILYFLSINPKYLGVSSGFRLLFVIIPGLGYLWWRLYGKKKEEK